MGDFMNKTFLKTALILGLMANVETGVMAQTITTPTPETKTTAETPDELSPPAELTSKTPTPEHAETAIKLDQAKIQERMENFKADIRKKCESLLKLGSPAAQDEVVTKICGLVGCEIDGWCSNNKRKN